VAAEVCGNCGLPVETEKAVRLDGQLLHVETCFAAGLRAVAHTVAELDVMLAPTMEPMVAYRAGKTFVATIVAERRKRPAPKQQAFSAASFARGKR
jgi:hypothetical protein